MSEAQPSYMSELYGAIKPLIIGRNALETVYALTLISYLVGKFNGLTAHESYHMLEEVREMLRTGTSPEDIRDMARAGAGT